MYTDFKNNGACDDGLDFMTELGAESWTLTQIYQYCFDNGHADYIEWLFKVGYTLYDDVRVNWDKLSGYDWWLLLRKQPQFAEHCQWDKLSGDDLSLLLREQPQLSDNRIE